MIFIIQKTTTRGNTRHECSLPVHQRIPEPNNKSPHSEKPLKRDVYLESYGILEYPADSGLSNKKSRSSFRNLICDSTSFVPMGSPLTICARIICGTRKTFVMQRRRKERIHAPQRTFVNASEKRYENDAFRSEDDVPSCA